MYPKRVEKIVQNTCQKHTIVHYYNESVRVEPRLHCQDFPLARMLIFLVSYSVWL